MQELSKEMENVLTVHRTARVATKDYAIVALQDLIWIMGNVCLNVLMKRLSKKIIAMCVYGNIQCAWIMMKPTKDNVVHVEKWIMISF